MACRRYLTRPTRSHHTRRQFGYDVTAADRDVTDEDDNVRWSSNVRLPVTAVEREVSA